MRAGRAAALALLAAGCAWSAAGAPQCSLAAALRELVRAGLQVLWSEELVRPEMVVEREPDGGEPAGGDPVAQLRQLLAPHGLAARRGPGGGWLVVRAPERPATPRTANPAGPGARQPPAADTASEPAGRTFDAIVVTPQQTRFGGAGGEDRLGWSAEDVAALPHVGDEPMRLLHRVPGVAATDTASRLHLHGSTPRQVGFRLDGQEIAAPYHLEGLQGLFSVVAPEAVQRLDLVAGGFSAAEGNQLAGYVDVTTRSPAERLWIAGLSLFSTQALAGGRQPDGGSWLVAARRSNLEWWFGSVDFDGKLRPSYGDLYAKWTYLAGERSLFSAHGLVFEDRERFADGDEDFLSGRQTGLSSWLSLDSQWGLALSTRVQLAASHAGRRRRGFIDRGASHELDRRDSDTQSLALGLGFTGARAETTAGLTVRRFQADYDHAHVRNEEVDAFAPPRYMPFAAQVARREGDAGAFVVERYGLGARSTLEMGLRWDRQSATGEAQWSPRLGLAHALGEATTLRAAWGLYHQAQGVDELAIEDGDLAVYPAERAEQRLLSLDHRFPGTLALRLTAYDQRLSRLRPRYENLFDPLDLFPGLGADRVRIAPQRGRAQGIDLLLRRQRGRLLWSLGYSYARAEDRVDGRWVPRAWDQPHALVAELDLQPRQAWRVHLAATLHSGWPTTRLELASQPDPDGAPRLAAVRGPRNGERLATYSRWDLRLSRSVPTARGNLEVFFDVFNLFNRENPCCVDEFAVVPQPDGSATLAAKLVGRLPRIPSFGLTWRLR